MSNPMDICKAVVNMSHAVYLALVFEVFSILILKLATIQFLIPSAVKMEWFPIFPHIFSSICCWLFYSFLFGILTRVRWNTKVVSSFSSLIAWGGDIFLRYFITSFISSFENSVYISRS